MVSLSQPRALILLPPLIGLAVAFWWAARRGGGALPGDWSRLIAPPLRAALDPRATERAPQRLLLATAAACSLVVALAGPSLELGKPETYPNLVGRVIVFDLPPAPAPPAQRGAAERLIEDAPTVPTALVAASSEAFDVTPLTTDADHLSRYLAVLTPDAMPTPGRDPAAGLLRAEAMLARAGVIAGQVVFVAAAPPPEGVRRLPAVADGVVRLIVAPEESREAWRRVAPGWDARITTTGDLSGVGEALARARREARRLAPSGGEKSVGPWFVALAALLWLGLFRRGGEA